MSAAVRQLLAAAANTVDGVQVQPYFMQTTSAGHGAVRLDRVEYPDQITDGLAHWSVVVILPTDPAQAEKWLDQRLRLLRDAISAELVVTSARPERITLDVGVLSCVFINGHREED